MAPITLMQLDKAAEILTGAYLRLSLDDFKAIRWSEGERMAEHYWRHFSQTYRNNLMAFLNYLGHNEDRQRFLLYILRTIGEHYAEAG